MHQALCADTVLIKKVLTLTSKGSYAVLAYQQKKLILFQHCALTTWFPTIPDNAQRNLLKPEPFAMSHKFDVACLPTVTCCNTCMLRDVCCVLGQTQ